MPRFPEHIEKLKINFKIIPATFVLIDCLVKIMCCDFGINTIAHKLHFMLPISNMISNSVEFIKSVIERLLCRCRLCIWNFQEINDRYWILHGIQNILYPNIPMYTRICTCIHLNFFAKCFADYRLILIARNRRVIQ